MLAALTRAEHEGIVHRDVKPENVLVSPDGHVKIADFGIAKAINRVNPSGFLTATGMAIGTPAYMAPEQAMAGAIGPWTDLYAVGCIAYELFTSTIPFAAPENQMAMLVRRINEPIPPPDTVNPALPAQLSAWIAGLLARDPGARTRSAETAANELEDIVIGIAGPRWRRTSRLPATAVEAEVDPLTTTGAPRPPATRRPIEGRFGEAGSAAGTEPRPEVVASTDVETPPPDHAIPGPYTPPPDEAIPALHPPPDDAIPGPYTPPPDDAIPGPYTPPPDDAFVTFRPSAEARTEHQDEPTAPPDSVPAEQESEPIAAPADEAAGERADETAAAPDEDAEPTSYETYREPPAAAAADRPRAGARPGISVRTRTGADTGARAGTGPTASAAAGHHAEPDDGSRCRGHDPAGQATAAPPRAGPNSGAGRHRGSQEARTVDRRSRSPGPARTHRLPRPAPVGAREPRETCGPRGTV